MYSRFPILTLSSRYTGLHDALLTPEVWHLLCHSISRVNNSILLLQTGSAANSFQTAPVTFPLDLDAMRASFESHGIHRSRLIFVDRPVQSEWAGMLAAAAAAAAADVVVDFSASCTYALAVAAPVSVLARLVMQHGEAKSRLRAGADRAAGAAISSSRRWCLSLCSTSCPAPSVLFHQKTGIVSFPHNVSQRRYFLNCAFLSSSAALPATSKTVSFRFWHRPENARACHVRSQMR